jgi:SAM-dependent methyltransferase
MTDCIVCNSKSIKILKKDNEYSFLECNKCGLLMVQPIPLELFKEQYRDNFFSDVNWAGSSRHIFDQQVTVANMKLKRRLKFISDKLNSNPKRVLEIGAGQGAWSIAFENNNIQYLGIEIDKRAVEAGRKFGANLLLGDFISEELDITSLGKFDMIFSSQVFEHIMKPHIFLERVKMLLNKGGILYLDIPNPHGLISVIKKIKILNLENKKFERDFLNLQPPWHFVAYPDKTLKYILKLHGFNIYYFSHPGFSHATFGQLVKFNQLTKMMNIFLSLVDYGSITLSISKNI